MPSSSGYLRSIPNPAQPLGGGTSKAFFVNDSTIAYSYTVPASKNAMTAGPVTINSGVTVTIPSGSTWTVI
jgi:hypothetical protein